MSSCSRPGPARLLLRLAAALTVAALTACPPPPDVDRGGGPPPKVGDGSGETGGTGTGTAGAPEGGDGTRPAPGPGSPAGAGPVAETTRAPAPVDRLVDSEYEKLPGGVFVARCSACGEVQAEGSTRCPTCQQRLVPWKKEAVCGVCGGEGRCRRCGDDRTCLACGGVATCPYCDGRGRSADGTQDCEECGGAGRCRECGGDGLRESAGNDFLPHETALPGVCPTCPDGSGLCPECGTTGLAPDGVECRSCLGTRLCWDCGGSGVCPHDAGAGLCPACAGGGREVVNGPLRPPTHRRWLIRTANGTVIEGRLAGRPNPNVHVLVKQGTQETLQAFPPSQLDPLSVFQAMRDYLQPDDGQGHLDLAVVAEKGDEEGGFYPLALWALRRAMAADPTVAAEATAAMGLVETRRVQAWLKRAQEAVKAGDFATGIQLLEMVRFKAHGSAQGKQAEVQLLTAKSQMELAERGMDEETRQNVAAQAAETVLRAAHRAKARIGLARRLLRDADGLDLSDHAVELLYERADRAAWDAWRLVNRTVHRHPPGSAQWPVPPADLQREARETRGKVNVAHAIHESAGGRFAVAVEKARRAGRFLPGDSHVAGVLREAELGVVRRGVRQGTAPPDKR